MIPHSGIPTAHSPRAIVALVIALLPTVPAAAEPPKPLISGLKNPTAVAVGADGRLYVALAGEPGKAGAVVRIEKGGVTPFAAGLDSPRGLVAWKDGFFVADRDKVRRIAKTGKVESHLDAAAFPKAPAALSDLEFDEKGNLYVLDSGDGKAGAIHRVGPKNKIDVLADGRKNAAIKSPAGLALDGVHFALLLDAASGELQRVRFADGSVEKLAGGLGGGSLAFDKFGRLFLGDSAKGRILAIPRPGIAPVVVAEGFQSVGKFCLDAAGKTLYVPDPRAGTLTALPTTIPGHEVDDSPMPLKPEIAFPNLKWAGWQGITDSGLPNPLRPLILTHAGDGSNRVFLATQHGVIHVFPNDPKAEKTEIFLDLSDRVRYDDKSNEEGFLGLAFHPKFKENGELFVFYTLKNAKLTNLLSRFRVNKDNPGRADPASEEVLLRIERPFWNHDGGTIAFGPDGHLYVALGDGGAANDPFGHGQNLSTLLGKILRIDIDRKDAGKAYAVPADNPFVGRNNVRPEIWAYGLRNVWRMSFDRKTGKLWAADVGQDLFEEINILSAGGNFGWNLRESLHPFGNKGVGPNPNMIDPIWEYHHSVGKSITGGHVYRGSRVPELAGHYLYADYVTGVLWALRYDETAGRVTANRRIPAPAFAVVSWGEDETGEVYFLVVTVKGQGIYRLSPAPAAK